jgi:WD40 repeat protein
MELLSGAGTRILLAGTGQHVPNSQLPGLPSVSTTIIDLADTLNECCGARPNQVLDPADPGVLGRELTAAAADAEDVLLFWYLGHGLLDARGELYLATQATDHLRDGLRYKALPYATLHDELAKSRARSVIVVLDCCFSGRAAGAPYPAELDGFATARVSGSYLLASAAPEEQALAPPGERHTAFTGQLIRLLREGDPAGPREFTLDHIYRYLDRALPEKSWPRPRRYASGRINELAFAPNHAYQPPQPRPAPAPADVLCPYRGLAAYDVTDAEYFFGREALTERLATRLAEQLSRAGTLVVVGPSGSGKSSLLRAGLIPALERHGLPDILGSRSWPVLPVFTPSDHPLESLARQIAPVAGETASTLRERLAGDAGELISVVGTVLSRHTPGADRMVLVVDQFEEIFTACQDAAERQTFLDALTATAASNALVVIGVRADFYAQCAAEPQLVEPLQHSQLIVNRMNANELRAVVEKPADRAGLRLEPGLADLILSDLRGSESGLPFLSYALFETFHRREGHLLTLAGYQDSGGIQRAVAEGAEKCYAKLNETEQETARLMLLRMVHLGQDGTADTLRRVHRADLPATETAHQILNTFAEARLITLGEDTVEIAHEALLQAWPRLRQWTNTDRTGNLIRQELEEAAAAWDRGRRDPAVLYRGSRLEAARAWADSHHDDLTPAAAEFLVASTGQESRAARLRRIVLFALSTLTLFAVLAAVVAFIQTGNAQRERDTAILNQVVAQADRLVNTDPSLAAQLALTAYRMRPTENLRTTLITDANSPLSTPLTGHTEAVRAAAFSPDGRTLASGSDDRSVRLWNVGDPANPAPLGVPLTGHTSAVNSVAFSPDGGTLASGGYDGMIRLWNVGDPANPAPLGVPLAGHANAISSVAFSPDGGTLASGGYDGTMRLWNVSDPAKPVPLGGPGHSSAVYSVAFSPDGRMLATGSFDGIVQLWNVSDPAKPVPLGEPLAGHTNSVYSVAFSPDGQTLASGSADQSVLLWNLSELTRPALLGELKNSSSNVVLSVSFSPDGRTLASANAAQIVQLWNLSDLRYVAALGLPLTGHTSAVNSVVFSPDGRTLASASFDHSVRLWSLPNEILTGHTDSVNSVAFSPDGRTLSSGSFDGTVRLWDVSDPGKPMLLGEPLAGNTDAVHSVAFSPDGRMLASGGADQNVRLWNLGNPAKPIAFDQPLTGHIDSVSSVTFSPDGQMLAAGSSDGMVRLWDVSDPTKPMLLGEPLAGHADAVNSVAFSPDGRMLASGGADQNIRLWNLDDRAHVTPLEPSLIGHAGQVGAVAFSSDGRTLASGSVDQTVRLWSVSDSAGSAHLNGPLTGHTNTVGDVAFSSDGRTLASGSVDWTIRLWNVSDSADGRPLGQYLAGHTEAVRALAFSPDGRTLASGSGDLTVRLWHMDVDEAIERVCATTANVLTPDKWREYVSPDLPYNPPCQ